MIYRNDSAGAVMALERQRLREFDEPKSICKCDWCGEDIYPGEDILKAKNEIFHKYCVCHNMNAEDILDVLGFEFEEA